MQRSARITSRLKTGESLGDRILKVDHAGENGAIWIYAGQIAIGRWFFRADVSQLRQFQADEMNHRRAFGEELSRRQLPRCRSFMLCGMGGLVLGIATGLLGARAVAATTVAVERVVLAHLKSQLEALGATDGRASNAISGIIHEEASHHDLASHSAPTWLLSAVLMPVVSASTELVIWLGMRL